MLPVILSLLPGLGHLLLERRKKAVSLLLMSAASLAGIFFSGWVLFKMIAGGIYLSVAANAIWETYSLVYLKKEAKDSPLFVIFLLLTAGFSALPLLWQSSAFNKKSKIVWTVTVIILAGSFFALLFFWGNKIERWLND